MQLNLNMNAVNRQYLHSLMKDDDFVEYLLF